MNEDRNPKAEGRRNPGFRIPNSGTAGFRPSTFGLRSSDLRAARGSVLVVVLWIVLVLSLMVSTFAAMMHIETRMAGYHSRQLQAKALAIAGIEYEKALLAADLNPSSDINAQTQARRQGSGTAASGTAATSAAQTSTQGADYYSEPWHNNVELVEHELGDGTFTVQIVDEQAKLNINVLTPDQWRVLLRACGVDSETATVISDAVADWMDKDDLSKPNGAEDDYYTSLPPEEGGPYHCKNAAFDGIEELLLVKGVTRDIFYGHSAESATDSEMTGIGQFLTALPFTKVNINTAPPQVLQCIPGVTPDMAEKLVRYRQGDDGIDGTDDDKPFQAVDEIATVWSGMLSRNSFQQLRNYLDVKSSFFTIRSVGNLGGVRKTIVTTVYRSDDGTISTITWDEQTR
ncbi:MAG: general secretion pathway protein GspK [Verrucomicrobia bacterium]|nr:general secretion pathway protein GspK [Verrucomicrobiota bacterium]